MKLHSLELQCFGPFRDRQRVEFDAFDADGLFLISGRTGAGKSSILDGVCYALYGTAPRYDGSDRGLRSDHAQPHELTQVRLEFSAGASRWRVTRTPEYSRPKARGEGLTTQKSTVLVEQRIGDVWVGRAAKHREAADVLEGILGLNRDQFQQVILLAQNQFAEFLLANNDDRQALLRTLFGSRRYEEYEKEFESRRRAAQQSVEADGAALHAHLAHAESIVAENDLGGGAQPDDAAVVVESPAVRLEAVERAVLRARYRADESDRRQDQAQRAHDDALAAFGARSAVRKKQEERAASRLVFAQLEERAPAVAADRVRLDRARQAEALRSTIVSTAGARDAATRAAELEGSARAAWTSMGEEDAASAALRVIVDDIAGDLAVWAKAAELEDELPTLEAGLVRANGSVSTLESGLASLAEATVARSDRISVLEPELGAAESTGAPVEPARAALAAAAERCDAGREADRLALEVRAAEAAHLYAAAEHEHASAAVRALLQRRLDGYAGELAAGLSHGESCPVCGSLEHPSPAPAADEPVTDEAIAAAEAAVDVAGRLVDEASAQAREARARHQEASARAGGETLERLEAAHADAAARLEAAVDAAAAIAGLKRELRELRDADSAAASERESLGSRLAAIKEERAALTQEATAARAAVDEARGGHAAVVDRIAASRGRRDAARLLADAADDRARLDVVAASAAADLDERLRDSAFADASEASSALLTAGEATALAERIRAYEIAIATERERLLALETELAGQPDELVDLEAASAAAVAARDAWNVAVAAAARDAEVAAQLTDAAARAAVVLDGCAVRAAEYEVITGLANAIAGRTDSRMDLETFVLAGELEEIVEAANLRLDVMSAGRYRLQHTDAVGARRVASGLGIDVMDAHTGQGRSAQSLSGGETFLASLALALGLAEVVTARAGGVRLDTLFIDEGFGSLDDETLELAMQTLDELRQGGRTVGLISHVATMKERLPAQLIVEATPHGPSIIRQQAGIPV